MASKSFLLPCAMVFATAGMSYATLIVDITAAANYTVNDLTAGDQISILNGPIVSGVQTTEIISTLDNFTLEVANKVNLTVNTGGGDTITLNISILAAGLTTLTVNGGNGADTFLVTPSAVIPFTINGGGNPQAAPGNVLTVDLTGLTGANLSDTNTANGFQGSWTFTNSQAVNFTGIETLLPSQAAPEPGVLPLVAAGLAGLVIARIRMGSSASA